MQEYINALIAILSTPIVLMGYTITLLDVVLYLIFGGVICFIIGGLLK